MARVTVEDCTNNVENRFELVLLAAERAGQIFSGAPLTVDRDNDKNAVVALREIAENTVKVTNLRDDLVKYHQKHKVIEQEEALDGTLLAAQIDNDFPMQDELSEEDLLRALNAKGGVNKEG